MTTQSDHDIVAEFLKTNMEEYLLRDVESLLQTAHRPPEFGACSYPLLMTVCSGIELIGAVSSDKGFSTNGGDRYFLAHWNTMYTGSPLEPAGPGVYGLIRDGLAHLFLMKGPFDVTKNYYRDGPAMKRTDSTVTIDGARLAQDFAVSYPAARQKLLADPTEPAKRVREIWSFAKMRADRVMACFAGLPTADRPPVCYTTRAPEPLIADYWERR